MAQSLTVNSRTNSTSLNLLSSMNRVEVPFIKVTIGGYVFGVYDRIRSGLSVDEYGAYRLNGIKFPNYVKSLNITKINGQVNTYNLALEYTVRETDDPNFIEKVFSSVSEGRKIVFSYGDLSVPSYCYRDEEAIILKVTSDFNIASSRIVYNVEAVSSANLLSVEKHPLLSKRKAQPSMVIEELLKDDRFGLLEIFYGMRNGLSIGGKSLIPHNDMIKNIEAQTNMSILDYLKYLVNEMTPVDNSNVVKNSVYVLTIHDDTSGELNGPYFEIVQVDNQITQPDAYQIDIGYPNKDIVLDFHIENDESYSIYYKYSMKMNQETYVQRVNPRGEIEEVYAPIISSGNAHYNTKESDKSWWTKVTSYPVKASVTLKGLLRPATLMTHVRLNIYFYGKKHISSGLYIVTRQQDSISESGFKTVLNLVRIAGDE